MTTTVKVITHAWPVDVTTTDQVAGGDDVHTVERVEPRRARDFYIHSTRSIRFLELPEPEKAADPVEESVA